MKEVCNGQLYIVDGNYLINRSGPRVVESCEAIAEAIHPDLQGHFGHFGSDYLTTFDHAIALAEAGEVTGSAKVRPPPLAEEKVENENSYSSTNTNANNKEGGNISPPTMNPAETVTVQLEHLQNGEHTKAFGMNSSANQDRWCSPDRFLAVLRSHNDFKRLLDKDNGISVELDALKDKEGGIATVKVFLPALQNNDAVVLLWTMIAEIPSGSKQAAWRTEKVGISS